MRERRSMKISKSVPVSSVPYWLPVWVGLFFLSGCCCGGGGSKKEAHYTQSYRSVKGVNAFVDPAKNLRVQTVAITPFKASTELIGASVSDLFLTELLMLRRYRIVERGQLANVLGEAELALAGLSDARAMEAGRMSGADAVIVGSVSEYEMAAYKGRTYPSVGMSIRCIDSQTGEIVWSADYTERAKDKNVSLSAHARKVVHAIAATLYQRGLDGSKRR